jgi:acetylornithine deacetylase/succinyl-diaminopimelate desuccinylase-like protein
MLVEVELMPNASDDEIITRETELIEKFLPTYNLRKGADVHKDPDRYKISEESRALLDMRVKEYEEEQEARAEYEAALREYEEAEAERQAQEEALLQAAEQDAPPEEIKEIKEELQEAKAEVKEAEKELAKVKRRYTFKKNSFKIRRKK